MILRTVIVSLFCGFVCAVFYGGICLADTLSSQPILYIGDSISDGLFGGTIDQDLRSVSSNVKTLAWCGSTPATWMNNAPRARTICGFWEHDPSGSQSRALPKSAPNFVDELASVKPRVTVVQLGTNIAAIYPELGGKAKDSAQAMMEQIKSHGSQCVWIGPPPVDPRKEHVISLEKLNETSMMIKNVALSEGCTYIDTLKAIPLVKGPTVDGIHPKGFLGQAWADILWAPQSPGAQPLLRKAVTEGLLSAPDLPYSSSTAASTPPSPSSEATFPSSAGAAQ
jgi:hypothetical protein